MTVFGRGTQVWSKRRLSGGSDWNLRRSIRFSQIPCAAPGGYPYSGLFVLSYGSCLVTAWEHSLASVWWLLQLDCCPKVVCPLCPSMSLPCGIAVCRSPTSTLSFSQHVAAMKWFWLETTLLVPVAPFYRSDVERVASDPFGQPEWITRLSKRVFQPPLLSGLFALPRCTKHVENNQTWCGFWWLRRVEVPDLRKEFFVKVMWLKWWSCKPAWHRCLRLLEIFWNMYFKTRKNTIRFWS